MKKGPAHKYESQTGRVGITGQMAEESALRQITWLKNGCNAFEAKRKVSNPMSFWTEQDVLKYIKENGENMIESRKAIFKHNHDMTEEEYKNEFENGEWGAVASVYGDIVQDEEKSELPEGQLCFLSDEHIMLGKSGELLETSCVYKTTGCRRTGCMFCGFGCHLEKPGEGRFEKMKVTHPKLYDWIMKPTEEGGLGYKGVIDWLNENGGLNIRY